MILQAIHDYSNKQQHGIRWGLNVFRGPGYRIRLRELGGDLERLPEQRLDLLTSDDRVLMMGNSWIHRDPRDRLWHHPHRVIDRVKEFYFWDNPSLPHILYRGAHNPLGFKNWMRLVKNHWMPQPLGGDLEHESRINRELAQTSQGQIQHWLDLVGETRPVEPRGRDVLVIESSSQVYSHYAQTTRARWLADIEHECRRQGLGMITRSKQSRAQRHTQGELRDVLSDTRWYATISFQSMAVVESLLAGVPAVNYLGEPALRDLVTPWEEFLLGQVRTHTRDLVVDQVRGLLATTWHKTSAYQGEWNACNQ